MAEIFSISFKPVGLTELPLWESSMVAVQWSAVLGATAVAATTVEAALVLTLLILLTIGVIKYSWMFFTFRQVTNVARPGAWASDHEENQAVKPRRDTH